MTSFWQLYLATILGRWTRQASLAGRRPQRPARPAVLMAWQKSSVLQDTRKTGRPAWPAGMVTSATPAALDQTWAELRWVWRVDSLHFPAVSMVSISFDYWISIDLSQGVQDAQDPGKGVCGYKCQQEILNFGGEHPNHNLAFGTLVTHIRSIMPDLPYLM